MEAVTINTFFSIQVGEERLNESDHSFFDVIVLDEIYFDSIPVLARIETFVEKNPDKIIVATGDEHQLQGVVDITNTHDYRTYLDSCIKQIFSNFIAFCQSFLNIVSASVLTLKTSMSCSTLKTSMSCSRSVL